MSEKNDIFQFFENEKCIRNFARQILNIFIFMRTKNIFYPIKYLRERAILICYKLQISTIILLTNLIEG